LRDWFALTECLLLWSADSAERKTRVAAKCIVVDGAHVFVSSANFTEAAQERNIEVGLLIQSRALAERVRRFFDALLDSSYFGRAI